MSEKLHRIVEFIAYNLNGIKIKIMKSIPLYKSLLHGTSAARRPSSLFYSYGSVDVVLFVDVSARYVRPFVVHRSALTSHILFGDVHGRDSRPGHFEHGFQKQRFLKQTFQKICNRYTRKQTMIALRPLAPVFLSIARLAMASRASGCERQLALVHRQQSLVLGQERVLGLRQNPDQHVFVEAVERYQNWEPSDELLRIDIRRSSRF
jgi:hypothetical protein